MYPGFNGSVASLRARREHTGSAGACTKPKVKGCRRSPPPGGRWKALPGVPRALARLPRRGASPLAALARVRLAWGVPGYCAPQAAGTFHPTGVFHARVSPRFLSEGRWAAASGSSCNLPPFSPPPGDRLFTLFFFLCTRCCCLPPEPLPAAGRHPLAAACALRLGGEGWQAPQHSSRQRRQLTLDSTTDDPGKRETPASWAQVVKKRCKGLLGKEQRGMIAGSAPSLRCSSRSKGPLPGPPPWCGEVEGSRRQGRKRRREKQGNADCSWRGSKFSHLLLSSLCCTHKLPLSLM